MQKRKISIILGVALIGLLAMLLVNEASAANISSDFYWSSGPTITPSANGKTRTFNGVLSPIDPTKDYNIDSIGTVNSLTGTNFSSYAMSVTGTLVDGNVKPPITINIVLTLTNKNARYSVWFNLLGVQVP
jgi:hypothetical protein